MSLFRVSGSLSARTAPVAAAAGALLSKHSYTVAAVPIQARVRASLKANNIRKNAPTRLYTSNLDLRGGTGLRAWPFNHSNILAS